jgi:hypothetical protein
MKIDLTLKQSTLLNLNTRAKHTQTIFLKHTQQSSLQRLLRLLLKMKKEIFLRLLPALA